MSDPIDKSKDRLPYLPDKYPPISTAIVATAKGGAVKS